MHLLPRDLKFYDQFLAQSGLAFKAAAILHEAAASGGGRIADAARVLRDLEQQGDDLEHEVFRRLHKTFITPIDPEDIHVISVALDGVLDAIEAIGYRLHAYGYSQGPERMVKLAEVLENCTKELNALFETLNAEGIEKQEALTEHCERVNQLENESKLLAREAVADAFANQKDPVELMRQMAIYDHFEKAGDRCEDVADFIANVLAKHS